MQYLDNSQELAAFVLLKTLTTLCGTRECQTPITVHQSIEHRPNPYLSYHMKNAEIVQEKKIVTIFGCLITYVLAALVLLKKTTLTTYSVVRHLCTSNHWIQEIFIFVISNKKCRQCSRGNFATSFRCSITDVFGCTCASKNINNLSCYNCTSNH